ncbi:hypothetical protein KGA66_03275 [Actinocrinis puniceicyclus]|uniref:Uncharacterized protein n=1 Tax=Actinocrinis puniceicyclus TaxID=977794 RepID=A0A8J7WM75_9ACTN|nr:hypothetical protein [Actinocrinis puniceicyclus]MBS2962055.1 hypothetical protein [Actinocrinis puniceicyclus]
MSERSQPGGSFTARQVGMAMGVALLGSLIAMRDSLLGLRVSTLLVALCFLTIIVLSLRCVPRKEHQV